METIPTNEISTVQNANVPEIEKLVRKSLAKADLPDFYYNYIAGMISEEPPSSPEELFSLIGEFIMNGGNINRQDGFALCQQVITTLKDQKLISTDSKLSLIAEKLMAPVTLNEVKLRQSKDNTAGYTDAFLGTERITFDDGVLKDKKIDKKAKKEMEAFEKHKEEMMALRKRLPPMRVDHNKDSNKSRDLILENVVLTVGGRTLLEGATVRLTEGRKYGLIGRNGIGKTTLLNAIARKDFDKFPMHLQILLVEQEVVGDDKTVLRTVLETDYERDQLLKEEQELLAGANEKDDKGRLAEIYKRLDEIDARTAESRASKILHGLGFSQEDMHRATKTFSGGWRMRVSLARALFVQPDILLLDEPTNHLDLDAVMWLEDYLIHWPHTCVIVSHAREFLNNVCTDVYHFFQEKLTYYKGNYDQFEQTRTEKLRNSKKEAEAQKAKQEHMQKFIDKFRFNAKRASLVQSRIKALNRMEMIEEILEDPTCVFVFPTPEKLRPPLLKIEEGAFGYSSEKILMKDVDFGIDMESRVAIVGANGVGKTTFLKLLLNELSLMSGNLTRHQRLRTSLFTQHHQDQLDLMLSPVEQFVKSFPGSTVDAIRSHLGGFGITGTMQLRPQYLLSGGQKSRVSFAMTTWMNPHIMIMDEPTNHLDVDAVNALIVALNNFQGGVLIVSHDQHLIANVCDQVWYIRDKKLKRFHGDFEDYRRALASGKL